MAVRRISSAWLGKSYSMRHQGFRYGSSGRPRPLRRVLGLFESDDYLVSIVPLHPADALPLRFLDLPPGLNLREDPLLILSRHGLNRPGRPTAVILGLIVEIDVLTLQRLVDRLPAGPLRNQLQWAKDLLGVSILSNLDRESAFVSPRLGEVRHALRGVLPELQATLPNDADAARLRASLVDD